VLEKGGGAPRESTPRVRGEKNVIIENKAIWRLGPGLLAKREGLRNSDQCQPKQLKEFKAGKRNDVLFD